jgi:hypothetical protein
MFCQYCGTALGQGMSYCGSCGRAAGMPPVQLNQIQQEMVLYMADKVRITNANATFNSKVIPMQFIVSASGAEHISRGAFIGLCVATVVSQLIAAAATGIAIVTLPFTIPMMLIIIVTWKDRHAIDIQIQNGKHIRKRRFVLLGDGLVMNQTLQALNSALQIYRP